MKHVIRVGDPLSHGGQVVSGSSRMEVDGKAVARVGDRCVCRRHGSVSIVEGHPFFTVDGAHVAFHGHKTSCGASLMTTTERFGSDLQGGGAGQSVAGKGATGGGMAAAGGSVPGAAKEALVLEEGAQALALRVLTVGGPAEVTIEETVKYRVTGYNRVPTVAEKGQLRWKVEVHLRQGGLLEAFACEQRSDLFQVGPAELTLRKVPVKWSHATLKVFAYLKEPNDKASAQTKVNFKAFVIAETKRHKPCIGPDWRYGDYTTTKYESISSACKDDELLRKSDQDLLARMQNLLSHFATEDREGIATRMFRKFSTKEGGEFSDSSLNQKVQAHSNTKAFLDQVRRSFEQLLANTHGQVSTTMELNRDKDGWNRLYFNTEYDKSNGLMILIDEVWAYSLTLKDYEATAPNRYRANFRITLYDHFALDEEDIRTYGGSSPWSNNASIPKKVYLGTHPFIPVGFRSWFILQHIRGYQPVLTKVEFETSFQGAW